MTLGEKLQQLRKSKGLSQEQLAAQIAVSRQAISKWELGEAMPDTDNVVQLSKVFNVSIDYLLNDEYESDMDIPVVKETQTKMKRSYKKRIVTLLSVFLCASGIAIYFFAEWPFSFLGLTLCCGAIGLFVGVRVAPMIFRRSSGICLMCANLLPKTDERTCPYCGWTYRKR